jgi:hypothetical protein
MLVLQDFRVDECRAVSELGLLVADRLAVAPQYRNQTWDAICPGVAVAQILPQIG